MKIRLLLLCLSLFVVMVGAASAQTTAAAHTVTLTETRINEAFRVTNPSRVTVNNVSVDLQVGQVAINATLTPRRSSNANSYTVTAVIVPSVSSGIVRWTVTSVTSNGSPASQEILNLVNGSLASAWRTYFRQLYGKGRVQSITMDDATLTYTLTTSR